VSTVRSDDRKRWTSVILSHLSTDRTDANRHWMMQDGGAVAAGAAAPAPASRAHVALKIQRSAPEYYRAAHHEVPFHSIPFHSIPFHSIPAPEYSYCPSTRTTRLVHTLRSLSRRRARAAVPRLETRHAPRVPRLALPRGTARAALTRRCGSTSRTRIHIRRRRFLCFLSSVRRSSCSSA